jgi:diaminopimelate epimerase
MDLRFTKLRVCDDAWLIVDRRGAAGADPDWAACAKALCHRSRGAAARGLVVLEGAGAPLLARSWDARGEACPLSPSAIRWAFDNGLADGEAVRIMAREGEREAFALDSQSLGVGLGRVELNRARGGFTARAMGRELRLVLADGEPPRRPAAKPGREVAERRPSSLEAGVISRSRIVLSRLGEDGLLAAAVALTAAHEAGLADREASVEWRGELVLAQLLEDGEAYAAAVAAYVIRGEFWAGDLQPEK